MQSGLLIGKGIFWVLIWFGFMLFYTALDVAVWRKIGAPFGKYFNLVTMILCIAVFLFLLLDGGLRCIVPVAIIQGFPHLRAACGVDALPYCGNGGIRQLMYPLPAAQTAAAIGAARRIVPAANKLPHSADVLRCCSAAAAKDCRPVV